MANGHRAAVAEEILALVSKLNCKAQITMSESESKEITLRKGEIENLLTSTSISTGVRLFQNDKSAVIAFSGENFDNMEAKLKTALDNLQFLGEDPFKRLLTASEFQGDVLDLDLLDNCYDDLDIPAAVSALKLIEDKGLQYSKKIVPAGRAEFSCGRSHLHLWTSEGVNKTYSKTSYNFSYSAIAEENSLKERDYWSESKRFFSALPQGDALSNIGTIAAERAVKRLGGKQIPTGERKVIFARRVAGSLLGLLCDAVDGEEMVVNNSFLIDRLGDNVLPDNITIIDDPLLKKYRGSFPFDGEGMNSVAKTVFEKGKLQTYLHNSYSAGKLSMPLTGNASRSISGVPHIQIGNLYLKAGGGSLDDLVHEMKEGLLIEELFISGNNPITGDFSFGCTGFLVENGKVTAPVREITIAGNLLDLYKNVKAIADDNLWKSSITSPSIMVSGLTIAGS